MSKNADKYLIIIDGNEMLEHSKSVPDLYMVLSILKFEW